MKGGLGIIVTAILVVALLVGGGMAVRYFMAAPQGALDAEVPE